ncbi:hypothetical protein [Plastoroseomonas hellenica]|uniref:Uncharacterized protein n=1 Tax=Plastoroseomonas hellenica TaxID=2687306 RepID=A0ABS5F3S7_9PROT|nr:hypothetical protein [Plastoroseomonas hellenica]MBR0645984.1 hypothetical protein [Plastoroseomonas hellenica]MBR0667195.1 hypothetical protein [Plastoroseomonas hellenica]
MLDLLKLAVAFGIGIGTVMVAVGLGAGYADRRNLPSKLKARVTTVSWLGGIALAAGIVSLVFWLLGW